MPWAAGIYTRGYPSWSSDAASNLPISATKFDLEDNDFAAGLNNCITKDGLSTPSAALTWALSNGQILQLNRGSDGNVFGIGRTGGANNPSFKFSIADTGGLTISDGTGSLNINNSGAVTLLSGAGTAFTVNGAASAQVAAFNSGANTSATVGLVAPSGSYEALWTATVSGYALANFGVNNALSVDANGIPAQAVGMGTPQAIPMGLGTAGVTRLTISATGNVSIAAPSSGLALALAAGLSGTTGAFTGAVSAASFSSTGTGTTAAFGTTTTGQLTVTTNGTVVANFENQAGGVVATTIALGSSSSGYLSGGLSATTLSASSGSISLQYVTGGTLTTGLTVDQNGNTNVFNGVGLSPVYSGSPVNAQAGSYTTVATDANKTILQTLAGTHTFTIPANSTIPYPVGTLMTFINAAGASALTLSFGDTQVWTANGAINGTRQLASGGSATALKANSTTWYLSGSGLS